MSRCIDADALKANINTAFWSEIEKIIDSAPTIDAVEVVRCRECKYWRNTDAEKIPTASIACGNMHPYDFCSYGERRQRND